MAGNTKALTKEALDACLYGLSGVRREECEKYFNEAVGILNDDARVFSDFTVIITIPAVRRVLSNIWEPTEEEKDQVIHKDVYLKTDKRKKARQRFRVHSLINKIEDLHEKVGEAFKCFSNCDYEAEELMIIIKEYIMGIVKKQPEEFFEEFYENEVG